MNNRFVNPVCSSLKKQIYPNPTIYTPELLTEALLKKGLRVKMKNILKGGVVSQVYEATLKDKTVIVKHTEDVSPFDPTEIFISKKGHNQDTRILEKLSDSPKIKVPKVLYFFPDITTTIMEDVRENEYALLSDLLLGKSLPHNSAENVGQSLANLAIESRKWKRFSTNESARQNIYERGLELRLAYPNTQEEYLSLENEFLTNDNFWVWPDGHPKNIFVNPKGEVILIDFGRSVWGDQRYMLPNFLSHIIIYSLSGYYSVEKAGDYVVSCINAYKKLESIDEAVFCRYLGMEILHRANGKWLTGIKTAEQKVKLFQFGLNIFDKKITTVQDLLNYLNES